MPHQHFAKMIAIIVIVLVATFIAAKTSAASAVWPPLPPLGPLITGFTYTAYSYPAPNPHSLSSNATYAQCATICAHTPTCGAWSFTKHDCASATEPYVCTLYGEARHPMVAASVCSYSRTAQRQCTLKSLWTDTVSAVDPWPEFPRPQLVRAGGWWQSLNGMWQLLSEVYTGPILVPFAPESCLSGVQQYVGAQMWYERTFVVPPTVTQRVMLHFDAVDWNTTVYVNDRLAGPSHLGGYSRFSFDVTELVHRDGSPNVLVVYVEDPTDSGVQPFGKQRVSAVEAPAGDTYSPVSGIWQTVWLEERPTTGAITTVNVATPTTTAISVSVFVDDKNDDTVDDGVAMTFDVAVSDAVHGVITKGSGTVGGAVISIAIPTAYQRVWRPHDPHLYNVTVTTSTDTVRTYFGLRTFTLGRDANNRTRPLLNGEYTGMFLGFLDQGYWPDGLYTPPNMAAIVYDMNMTLQFGFNSLRKHQKQESDLWYAMTDTMGIIVFQDMIQHYGCPQAGDCPPSLPLYKADATAMMQQLHNHPSVVQWTAFNEGDMVNKGSFNDSVVTETVKWWQQLSGRLVDADSGGPANALGLGVANDIHSYPDPGHPIPTAQQYAMIGEFGGLGPTWSTTSQWRLGYCYAYGALSSAAELGARYINQTLALAAQRDTLSVAIYTQISDVELECDGFLNYDRTSKFTYLEMAAIAAANAKLTAN